MMRSLLLAALGITAFSATMAVDTPEANAVVYCAAGVVRAGCVVRPGVASVRGVARRTTRRVVRRSDMMLKHDISLLGHLDNDLGFYRFSYNGSDKAYVGVMAQEVQTVHARRGIARQRRLSAGLLRQARPEVPDLRPVDRVGRSMLDDQASLVLPAGTYGPGFLVLENFQVLRRYNSSDLYAIFVGHLADLIAGSPAFERVC